MISSSHHQWSCLPGTIILALVLSLQLAAVAADPTGPTWIRNLEAAKTQAKAVEKDLLIVFTGHGWCHACEILDRDVFQQDEFWRPASHHFVFVECDFNFGDTPEEQSRKEIYRHLQRKYLVRAFPTVVLADAAGVPYSIVTGYDEGTGPSKVLSLLRSAQEAKVRRDEHFELASQSAGEERIKHLHEGIQAIEPLLGPLEERGDDPVFAFYEKEIQQILKSAAASLADIRSQYAARQENREAWLARDLTSRSLMVELKAFEAVNNYQGAIDYTARALQKTSDPHLRWQLERARQAYLELDSEHEKALENARRLLKREDLSEQNREYLLDREAYNLFNVGKIDEGLAHYDSRIAAAEGSPEKQLRLLGWKAEMILNRNRPEQSIEVWRAYHKATTPGTDDWLTATAILARQLQEMAESEAALQLQEEFLEVQESPWIMLDAAQSHITLGKREEARSLINQAEAVSQALRRSDRRSDKEQANRIGDRINILREQLAGD